MEKKQIKTILLLLGLGMFVVAMLPFFTAREVMSMVPSGWHSVGEAQIIFAYKTTMSPVYRPDGSPAGFSDFPIDRTKFPFAMAVADYSFIIKTTFQNEDGVWLVIEYENKQGTLGIGMGRSLGVELDSNTRLYITRADMPTYSGDWRTVENEYFYGFKKITLSVVARG